MAFSQKSLILSPILGRRFALAQATVLNGLRPKIKTTIPHNF